MQPHVVPTRGLERALGNGKLDALALQACAELVDAPLCLGPVRVGFGLHFGDAVGQHLDLLLGVSMRGLARLERFRQIARAIQQRGTPLFEVTALAVERIAGRGEPLDGLLGVGASDVCLHHLAFEAPDVLGASDDSLAHLGEQLLRGRGTRTQRF